MLLSLLGLPLASCEPAGLVDAVAFRQVVLFHKEVYQLVAGDH